MTVQKATKTSTPKAVQKPKQVVTVFEHDNKFLYVDDVKAQFLDGKFETSDVQVIEYLKNRVQGVRYTEK